MEGILRITENMRPTHCKVFITVYNNKNLVHGAMRTGIVYGFYFLT
jgi:hypothetical protein